jgi:hypothetical protein
MDENVCVVLGPRRARSRARDSSPGGNLSPGVGCERELVGVAQPTGAIETSKNDQLPVVHHRYVPEPSGGGRPLDLAVGFHAASSAVGAAVAR